MSEIIVISTHLDTNGICRMSKSLLLSLKEGCHISVSRSLTSSTKAERTRETSSSPGVALYKVLFGNNSMRKKSGILSKLDVRLQFN